MKPLPVIGLCLVFGAAVLRADEAFPQALVAHVSSHRDGQPPWSIDFSRLESARADLPIGVFDSGIGGLTVLEAILRLDTFNNDTLQPGADGRPDFAGERFIYFGDQANMPYGNYPSQQREDFLRELILKDAVFLLGTRWHPAASAAPRHDKPPVKAIVIACNTATAYGLEDIRAALKAWQLDVPVIGVVEAGAREVAATLPDDGRKHSVAVLATVGTCATGAYPRAIGQAVGKSGKSAPVVVQQGSVGLAGAIEGNQAFVTTEPSRAVPYQGPALSPTDEPVDPATLASFGFDPAGLLGSANDPASLQLNSVPNYARYDVTTLLENHRRAGGPAIDTVVLGCTHFPLARTVLSDAFAEARTRRTTDGAQPFAESVAANIRFIDPAEATARELFRELARSRLRHKTSEPAAAPSATFYFSVPDPQSPGIQLSADGSLDPAYKLGRRTGRFAIEDTHAIPLTSETLPASTRALVQSLPTVWREMQGGH